MNDRVIGPYFFFENEESTAETVNGGMCQNMLNNFLAPDLSSKWIIVINSSFYKMGLLVIHLMHLFSCYMTCLARTSYPKDAH